MSETGQRAEQVAAQFLRRRGLELVARNYRCRYGEIDLIARDGKILVFVEVRMRASPTYGGAAGSITRAKRDKLARAARHYLAGLARVPACRFDAVLISGPDWTIEWLRNAFASDGSA